MRILVVVLGLAAILPSFGQSSAGTNCLPQAEFQPNVVRKSGSRVSFDCAGATPFDLISAVGYQTRLPIGIAIGRHEDVLLKHRQDYHLSNWKALTALTEAVRDTGFSVTEEHGIYHVTAGDLTPSQRSLLEHQFSNFKVGANETMVFQGAMLTASLRNVVDPTIGSGGSILGSTNDETFDLQLDSNVTTVEIADRIAAQGSGAMWVFRAGPLPSSSASTIEVEIWPYQHFTNMPVRNP